MRLDGLKTLRSVSLLFAFHKVLPGGQARMPLFGSYLACGLVLDALHLAKKLALTRSRLVRGCRLALASPSPGMTHQNEPAATGREPFTWLYRLFRMACQDSAKIST